MATETAVAVGPVLPSANILIITSSYPASPDDPSGTAGLFVRAFALELLKRGHRVIIQPVARKKLYTPDAGLIIEPLPWIGGDRELASLNLYAPHNWPAMLTFFWRARQQVLRVHEKYKIERTLCMWAVPAGLLGWMMHRRLGKPYDVWALGSDIWKIGKIPVLGKLLLQKILKNADRVFADGMGLCREVEELSGCRCEFLPSSRVLPSPRRAAEKKPGSAEHINLLFVGRYHENKGPDLLLEAMHALPQAVKEKIKLTMHGIGPLKNLLLDYVARYELEGYAAVDDGIGAQELSDELMRVDYLVIPSRIESIPVIFSDALQMGTPVIATPIGDLPDLIEQHSCGIVAEACSPQALARAIETACCHYWKADFSNNALRLWRKFSVEDTVEKWLNSFPAQVPGQPR